ncbi:MAG: site-specific integrase [Aureibaculum sp.]|nr:site-specific integrase [Aureibaculum sp.]
MATIQATLRRKPNKQKLYPIVIRITKDRKTTYIFTGQYIDKKYWDKVNRRVKGSHPNSARLNHLILTRLTQANDKLLEAETNDDYQSISTIKKKIVSKGKSDFFKVADEYLDYLLKSEKYNQLSANRSRIIKFKLFVGKKDLPFKELTIGLIKKFEVYLRHTEKKSPRTVMNYLLVIRTIYNRAVAESIINKDNYPFGKGKIQIIFPESEKNGLSIKEIKILENNKNLSNAQQHAINVWLLSFYFAGIRVGDILQLKWSDFKDGRLFYRMGKNKKLVSLKIPFKAKRILVFYRYVENSNDLVFPDLSGENISDKKILTRRIHTVNRNLNRHLKKIANKVGIKKNMSMHIARHSFGNISGDKIPIQMLQKLYRHSSVTTTINYQSNFMRKDADDALNKVINF